jgi:hypothetical protein
VLHLLLDLRLFTPASSVFQSTVYIFEATFVSSCFHPVYYFDRTTYSFQFLLEVLTVHPKFPVFWSVCLLLLSPISPSGMGGPASSCGSALWFVRITRAFSPQQTERHTYEGCADKFLARQGMKQATATKLGIYPTYSPTKLRTLLIPLL